MAIQLYTNNASGQLAALFDTPDTALTLGAGEGAAFPNPTGGDFFIATVENIAGDLEIIKVTARSGDVFTTVERAQESTTAQPFATGSRVECRLTAASLDNLLQKSDEALYFGADKKVVAKAFGAQLWGRDSAGNKDVVLELCDDTGATRLGFLWAKQGQDLRLVCEIHGLPISLQGEDAAGVAQSVFYGDPDAEVNLYHAGIVRLQTMADGARVFGNQYIDADIRFTGSGSHHILSGSTAALSVIEGGGVGVFHNNILKLLSIASGVHLYAQGAMATPPTSAQNPGYAQIGIVDSDGSDGLAQFGFLNGPTLYIANLIRGGEIIIGATHPAGAFVNGVHIDPNAAVSLYYAGSGKLATQSAGVQILGNLWISGGVISDGAISQGGVPVSLDGHSHTGIASKFASAEIGIITQATGTAAHGLGAHPDLVTACLRCVSPSLGYAINDEINIDHNTTDGSALTGFSVWANPTHVGYQIGQNINNYAMVRRDGTPGQIVAGAAQLANWRLIIRAVKFS